MELHLYLAWKPLFIHVGYLGLNQVNRGIGYRPPIKEDKCAVKKSAACFFSSLNHPLSQPMLCSLFMCEYFGEKLRENVLVIDESKY